MNQEDQDPDFDYELAEQLLNQVLVNLPSHNCSTFPQELHYITKQCDKRDDDDKTDFTFMRGQ